jgi:hypothetical protein
MVRSCREGAAAALLAPGTSRRRAPVTSTPSRRTCALYRSPASIISRRFCSR